MRGHPFDIDNNQDDDFLSSLSDDEIKWIIEAHEEFLGMMMKHKATIIIGFVIVAGLAATVAKFSGYL
jgi:hypothetical protein